MENKEVKVKETEKPAISRRNKNIIKLVKQGKCVKEIAEELKLEPETVEKELQYLLKIGMVKTFPLLVQVYQLTLETLKNIGLDIDVELNYYRTLSTEDWTDRDYFETLTRTVFSGIRNNIIEDRWNAISDAFSDFDFHKVSEYEEEKVQVLMGNDRIIRHEGKIKATIFNAKKMVEIVKEHGSFKNYLNFFPSIDSLAEQLQGYYGGFKGVGERNIYEFLKEISVQTIKPDRQVQKVFFRLGLIGEKAKLQEIVEIGMKIAKEVNQRACVVDWLLWRFGSEVCKAKPLCDKCLFDRSCSYRRNLK